MDDKTKLLIFDRKEVALIFLLIILVAICSFSFGVQLGRSISYQKAGLNPMDQSQIEILSSKEERAYQVTKQAPAGSNESMQEPVKEELREKDVNDTYNKLKEEFDRISGETYPKQGQPKNLEQVRKPDSSMAVPSKNATKDEGAKDRSSPYAGKYSIQLGSYQLKSDAVHFADGFRVRGYNPIIQEVNIKGKGLWYRVGLGIFDSLTEAKEFIEQEESLFKGQDYVITELH